MALVSSIHYFTALLGSGAADIGPEAECSLCRITETQSHLISYIRCTVSVAQMHQSKVQTFSKIN